MTGFVPERDVGEEKIPNLAATIEAKSRAPPKKNCFYGKKGNCPHQR